MNQTKLSIVFVTCPIFDADRIAEQIVTEKLAACVNIVPIRSIYTWEGELKHEEELLLMIKTTPQNYDRLEKRLKELHTYEVPEIVAVESDKVWQPYFDWAATQTS